MQDDYTRLIELGSRIVAEIRNDLGVTNGSSSRRMFMTETRQPVACACCGWTGKRMTGQPVTCPKCGAWATFQWAPATRDREG